MPYYTATFFSIIHEIKKKKKSLRKMFATTYVRKIVCSKIFFVWDGGFFLFLLPAQS